MNTQIYVHYLVGLLSLYLLSGDAHVIPHIRENSGFNEEPFQAQSFAATLQLGSFADATLDKLQHTILLFPTDLWRRRTERMWEARAGEKRRTLVCEIKWTWSNQFVAWWDGWCVVLTHLWTLLSRGIEGAADYPPLGSLHTSPDKLVIYGLLHVDARACCAALACVEKHALVGLFYSQIHW